MRNFLMLLLFTSFIACKNDKKVDETINAADLVIKQDNAVPTDPKNLTIPSACEMITEAQLQSILNISGAKVNIKPADDPGNMTAKSCFFKWEDASTPNAGILIQILTNPVYDEYPEYISKYVSTKLTEGETVLGNDAPSKYKKFSSNGIVGAYSFDQSRFYWNLNNDYLFMLAFNVSTLSEERMVEVAEKIVGEVNKNFAAKK